MLQHQIAAQHRDSDFGDIMAKRGIGISYGSIRSSRAPVEIVDRKTLQALSGTADP